MFLYLTAKGFIEVVLQSTFGCTLTSKECIQKSVEHELTLCVNINEKYLALLQVEKAINNLYLLRMFNVASL